MKSKKLTYVLLVVVALIWYKVFFRVKDSLFGSNEVLEHAAQIAPLELLVTNKDTIELNLKYRDPFGIQVKNEITETESNVEVQRPVVKEQFVWPSIKFIGRVQKTNSSNPLAIVRIDGIQLFVRKNDELFGDFRIKKIGRDSVVIRHKNESKIFWRN